MMSSKFMLFLAAIIGVSSVNSQYLRSKYIESKLIDYYDIDDINQFNSLVTKYDKHYRTVDDIMTAFESFLKNLEFIESHNNTSYTLELNEHFDLDEHQFKLYRSLNFNHFTNYHYSMLNEGSSICKPYVSTSDYTSLPSSIDWRSKAVTEVKNQGQCGSCWSFSSTGAMEGAHAVATGDLIELSEQQLMDCSWTYGDFGCNGGLMDNAFVYAIENGMCLESDVPYLAYDQRCSNMPSCEPVATFSYCFDVTSNNQQDLMLAVADQPVSVAIEADTKVFQFYKSGIIDSSDCGTSLDHGVLVVGYGTDSGQKYWIVKNSWGSDWGEDGYVRIERSESSDDAGICGIAMQPSFIVV